MLRSRRFLMVSAVSLFVSQIVTPAAHLPITSADATLAAAVVEEIERTCPVAGCRLADAPCRD